MVKVNGVNGMVTVMSRKIIKENVEEKELQSARRQTLCLTLVSLFNSYMLVSLSNESFPTFFIMVF